MRISSKVYEIKVFHFIKIILSMSIVIINHNIPNPISLVNAMNTSIPESSTKLGVINAKPNQAAERLALTAADALKKARIVLFMQGNLTEKVL